VEIGEQLLTVILRTVGAVPSHKGKQWSSHMDADTLWHDETL